MLDWLWVGERLSWPFFGIVVYSLAVVLVTDIIWRLVTLPTRYLLFAVGSVWAIGCVSVILSGY